MPSTTILYTVLDPTDRWALPTTAPDGTTTPGAWTDRLADDAHGLHVIHDPRQCIDLRPGSRLFEIEIEVRALDADSQSPPRRGRLLSEVAWGDYNIHFLSSGTLDTDALPSACHEPPIVVASGDARVVTASAIVQASGDARVEAYGNALVMARERAQVNAGGRCRVLAEGDAGVAARADADVIARERAQVWAHAHAHVRAHDDAHVSAWVDRLGIVIARDRARVIAHADARVVARDRVHVLARDRAQVDAHDDSTVDATGQSLVTTAEAGAGNRAQVRLGDSAVHLDRRGPVLVVTLGDGRVLECPPGPPSAS